MSKKKYYWNYNNYEILPSPISWEEEGIYNYEVNLKIEDETNPHKIGLLIINRSGDEIEIKTTGNRFTNYVPEEDKQKVLDGIFNCVKFIQDKINSEEW